MKKVSMLEFRLHAERIVQQVRKGQRMILTYRGQPALRLEPLQDEAADDDPFYRLDQIADTKGKSLTNQEMDATIYGE